MTDHTAPSMSSLERAWQDVDTFAIAALYAQAGRILPARRTAIEGPRDIAAFFAAGVSRVLLRFSAEQRMVADSLIFEAGICHDLERDTETLRERCHYTVVWVRDGARLLIQSHGWGAAI